jgi:hypothetical protein
VLGASKEVSLDVKTENKYMFVSFHQNVEQNRNFLTANKSFENVTKFKYLRERLTDQNCINEETKSRINSGNAYYHSFQSLLSSRILSVNIKTEIYKTIILPVIWYRCETWSLTLREEHTRRLKVFDNRVLRRIIRPTRQEVAGGWRR